MTDASSSCFAGYRVASEVPLPALSNLAGTDAGPPLRIRIHPHPPTQHAIDTPHWRHQWLDDDGSVNLQVAALETGTEREIERYLLRAPEQADFLLDPSAGTIAVDAPATLADNTLEHLLLDQAIPRLLAGRGHLVVHASIVRLRHRAIAFVGRSGWGKSTLAALLHRRGFPALCDDCALLERRGDTVFAHPSYPGLRLYADSIDQALDAAPSARPVSDYSDKQRIIGLELEPGLLQPQPLVALCLLDDPSHGADALGIEPIGSAAACMALIEHSFRLDPTDSARTARHLGQASAVAQAIPAFLLRHPRDFAHKDALINLLLAQFDTPGPDSP